MANPCAAKFAHQRVGFPTLGADVDAWLVGSARMSSSAGVGDRSLAPALIFCWLTFRGGETNRPSRPGSSDAALTRKR